MKRRQSTVHSPQMTVDRLILSNFARSFSSPIGSVKIGVKAHKDKVVLGCGDMLVGVIKVEAELLHGM